ncbi:MAG: DUF2062 domain-containing protein [Thiothrix sp.]|uniref:DUF2062 domain-containing protein n=1 Tax=Thiothrix sp. TaxID=1032 RepID=UPI002624B226|nr:DUF2062 domain-containing protein [Thiothrix sp.]MDD5394167.1 DUF2062 domain-containing protein [Thiothrix sp.]
MPRKFFRKLSPSPETIKQHKHLQFLGNTLHLACLWQLNRRTIPSAVAIGLFVMWLPVPFHVLLVALLVVLFRTNLPIALVTVFINNPLTMGPMYYADYKLGVLLLQSPAKHFKFEASLHWLTHGFLPLWKPLMTGAFSLAFVSAIIGFYGLHLVWRLYILQHLKERRKRDKTNVS